jgi:hypothetical protein
MRDLLDKLNAILSEEKTHISPSGVKTTMDSSDDDYEINYGKNGLVAKYRKSQGLDVETGSKKVEETFQLGDEFGISFNEDFEIASHIVGFLEDGIVIELDDQAINMLESQGLSFLDGQLEESKKKTLRNSNPCWKGYHPVGTKKKGGRTVPNCVPEAANPAQQAAIAINMKKHHKKPKHEDIEEAQFNSKQEVIAHFVKQGKSAASGAAAWERGWRGHTPKKKEVKPYDPEKYKHVRLPYKDESIENEDIKTAKAFPLQYAQGLYAEPTEEGVILYGEDIEIDGEPGERPTSWFDFTVNLTTGEKEVTGDRTNTDSGDSMFDYIDMDDVESYIDEIVAEWTEQYGRTWGEIDPEEGEIAAMPEAMYHGKNVPLGKKLPGDVKKSKVYVRDPKTGNVKKVNFGDKKMRIKKSNPARRKSFRARHHCANPGPRTKARYWSCRSW